MLERVGDDDKTIRLLRRVEEGDDDAAGELFQLVYRELHGMAARLMAGERKGHTLQSTALVNEAWLRLVGASGASFEDRRHFLRVSARAMRRVLIDHARARQTDKRGGERKPVPLDDALAWYEDQPVDLLALDEALERLGERDANLLRVVELRYFAGLTLEETGDVLGRALGQVHRDWTFVRGWLRRELEKGGDDRG